MADHTFESFAASLLTEVQTRLVAEHRRLLQGGCSDEAPPSSSLGVPDGPPPPESGPGARNSPGLFTGALRQRRFSRDLPALKAPVEPPHGAPRELDVHQAGQDVEDPAVKFPAGMPPQQLSGIQRPVQGVTFCDIQALPLSSSPSLLSTVIPASDGARRPSMLSSVIPASPSYAASDAGSRRGSLDAIPGRSPSDQSIVWGGSRRASVGSLTGELGPLASLYEEERSLVRLKSNESVMTPSERGSTPDEEQPSKLLLQQSSLEDPESRPVMARSKSSIHGLEHDEYRILPCWKNRTPTASGPRGSTHRVTTLLPSPSATSHAINQPEPVMEAEEKAASSKFMLHPSSSFIVAWGCLGLALICFEAVTIPLELSGLGLASAEARWLIRIYWTAVVPISFRTGFIDLEGSVDLDAWRAARRYTRTFLPLDMLVLACDWAEAFGLQSSSGLRATRSISVLRATRLVQRLSSASDSGIVARNVRSEESLLVAHIVKLVFSMLWFAHCTACAWYHIGVSGAETGWVQVEALESASSARRYATAAHWSLAHFSGEVMIAPANVEEQVFAITVLFVFFVFAAAFVSSITTSMTRLQLLTSQDASKLDALRRYLLDSDVPRSLAARVQRNAQHALWEQRRNVCESSVEALRHVSKPLREEIHFEIHSRILVTHPFFEHYNSYYHAGLRQICSHAVHSISAHADDVLFRNGEVPSVPKMLFVVCGQLVWSAPDSGAVLPKRASKRLSMKSTAPSIICPCGNAFMADSNFCRRCGNARIDPVNDEDLGVQRKVGAGTWLCEAVLWTTWTHTGTLIATSESRLLGLDAKRFNLLAKAFPTDHAPYYAERFVAQLNEAKCEGTAITDVGDDDNRLRERIRYAFPDVFDDSESDDDEDEEMDQWNEDGLAKASQHPSRKSNVSRVSAMSAMVRRGSILSSLGVIQEKPGASRAKGSILSTLGIIQEKPGANRAKAISVMGVQPGASRAKASVMGVLPKAGNAKANGRKNGSGTNIGNGLKKLRASFSFRGRGSVEPVTFTPFRNGGTSSNESGRLAPVGEAANGSEGSQCSQ